MFKRVHERLKHTPQGLVLLLMALPFVALIIAFSYVPLFGWIYAFTDYRPGMQFSDLSFTGVRSFVMFFFDSRGFLRVMRNTMVMSGLSLISTPLPVIFAILLNEIRNTRYRKLVQVLTTLPNFISWIIVFSLCFAIFASNGMLNMTLVRLGFEPIPTILANNEAVWGFQWALGTWKSLGWGAIIYIAAIAGIDTQLYEAAEIDGANRFQRIIHVTLPGLSNTYIVLLLLGIGNILRNGFEQFYVFYNPLVADRIQVLDYYVYRVGLLMNDYPMSTALGMSMTIISLTILFLANGISKKVRGDAIF